MFTDTTVIGRSNFTHISSWPFAVQVFPNLRYDEGKSVEYTASVHLQSPRVHFDDYGHLVAAAAREKLILPKEEGAFERMLKTADDNDEPTIATTKDEHLELRVNPKQYALHPEYVSAAMAADALGACHGRSAPTLLSRTLTSPYACIGSLIAGMIAGHASYPSEIAAAAGGIAGGVTWGFVAVNAYLAGVTEFRKDLLHITGRERALQAINAKLHNRPRASKYARLHSAAEAIFNDVRYRPGITLTYSHPDCEEVQRFTQQFCEETVVVPASEWES